MRVLTLGVLLLAACGPDPVYDDCTEEADCEGAGPEGATVACLPKGDEGFCSWACAGDDDCADPDDDHGGWDLVCASFESTEGTWCFPACRTEEDVDACPEGFTCRSTGGGDENRKVCFPEE